MAKFKKVDDLIGAFLDFDILDDEMPVATTNEAGEVVILTREEYAEFLEKKKKKEAKIKKAMKKADAGETSGAVESDKDETVKPETDAADTDK